jgi:transposase InsO family protein
VKYAFMEKHTREVSIKAMARVLEASRSGFYAWRQCRDKPSPRQRCREVRDAEIKAVFEAGKGRNGAIRVAKDLADLNVKCNRKTVSDSLRRQGLRAKAARKFKATTNSKHNFPVAPNLLEQDFDAGHPNQKWVGDITYL